MDLQKVKALLDRRPPGLNPLATRDQDAERAASSHPDPRPPFLRDGDKIVHSWSFTRYTGKTQVVFTRNFDMMSSRIIHVQLVSKTARYIARVLGFNQDLIEAIALGHDIGHPPYGHVGEMALSEISQDHGLGHYWHNYQAVRWLRDIEAHNLTLQTLDGILCHNGESRAFAAPVRPGKTFVDLASEMEAIQATGSKKVLNDLAPTTPEGCIVRLCDVIGYVGRDVEDAIVMGMIRREDVPPRVAEVLGSTNRQIVTALVNDLILCFVEDYPDVVGEAGANLSTTPGDLNFHFSPEVRDAANELLTFNYERIYQHPTVLEHNREVPSKMRQVFERYLEDLKGGVRDSPVFVDHVNFTRSYLASRGRESRYGTDEPPELVVRDFVAGMTEQYFERLHSGLGA
ncbi:MAG: deoxyguanosinetriphosphate triphosphohydrolase [Promethearchaeota archaeon]